MAKGSLANAMSPDDAALIGYTALRQRIAAISGPALGHAVMEALAKQVVFEAGRLAPRRTGQLVRTIEITDLRDDSARVAAKAKYATFVEEGTGLFGPQHQKITPQAKKALRWMGGPSGSLRLTGSARSGRAGAGAGYVFARSTKGMKAKPFLKPGAEKALASSGVAERIVAAWDGRS